MWCGDRWVAFALSNHESLSPNHGPNASLGRISRRSPCMIRMSRSAACAVAIALALGVPAAQATKPADAASLPAPDAALQAAINGSWRAEGNVARDPWRHPGQTLALFGIRPDTPVVGLPPCGRRHCGLLAADLPA